MADGDRNRLSGIEFLRFAAAFTVLIAHYNHFFVYRYASELPSIANQPLYGLFGPFYRYGTRAVEVFWCVSGFVFFFKYGRQIHEKCVPPMRFFWLRFSRLYPLHIATLLVVACLQWLYWAKNGSFYLYEFNDLKHFILNLFFASYWGFQNGFSFNGPIWSVSLEVLAYIFFYAVSYFIGADFFTAGICLIACSAATYFMGAEAVIVRCIFYFYLGGLSCLVYQAIVSRLKPLWAYMTLFPGLAIGAVAAHQFRVSGNLAWMLDLEVPLALTLLAILSRLLPDSVARAGNHLGNLTYASYLIHFPLQLLVMLGVSVFSITHNFAYSPVFFAGYILTVLIVSHFLYKRLEMPAQDMIRRRFVVTEERLERKPEFAN